MIDNATCLVADVNAWRRGNVVAQRAVWLYRDQLGNPARSLHTLRKMITWLQHKRLVNTSRSVASAIILLGMQDARHARLIEKNPDDGNLDLNTWSPGVVLGENLREPLGTWLPCTVIGNPEYTWQYILDIHNHRIIVLLHRHGYVIRWTDDLLAEPRDVEDEMCRCAEVGQTEVRAIPPKKPEQKP